MADHDEHGSGSDVSAIGLPAHAQQKGGGMIAQQIDLLPISTNDLITAAFRLAVLLGEMDDAEEQFKEAKESHKEHLTALKREVKNQRIIIRRGMEQEHLSEEGARKILDSVADDINAGVLDTGESRVTAEGRHGHP